MVVLNRVTQNEIKLFMDWLQRIRATISKSPIGVAKRKLKRAHISRPHFEAAPGLEKGKPLIFVVGRAFDQDRPDAPARITNGFARGWARAVGPSHLVPVNNLIRELENFDRPAIYLTIYHLSELSYSDCRKLRNFDVSISVTPHPRKIGELEKGWLGLSSGEDSNIWLENYGKVFLVEPKFVWNTVAKVGMEWYQGWVDDGLRWETIHLAADDELYFPEKNKEKFGQIQMAYVGGYWPEKAQAFDKYLRPFEDILWVYGYNKWPYKNYGGRINDAEERQLYSTAKIIPLVGCPNNWMTAEITERYFKAPACRGFCIADENPGLREIFTEEEMIQAKSADHFKQLVGEVLDGKIDTELWVKKAYEATRSRHLYSHRALQMLEALKR